MSNTVTIWPVPGRFLPGVPAVKQEVSPAAAKRLVESLAFTTKQPPTQGDEAKIKET